LQHEAAGDSLKFSTVGKKIWRGDIFQGGRGEKLKTPYPPMAGDQLDSVSLTKLS